MEIEKTRSHSCLFILEMRLRHIRLNELTRRMWAINKAMKIGAIGNDEITKYTEKRVVNTSPK